MRGWTAPRAMPRTRVAVVLAVLVAAMVSGLSTVPARGTAAPRSATGQNSQVVVDVSGSLGTVTSSPLSMSPAFSTTTTDYAIWCAAGSNNLNLTLVAATGSLTVGTQTASRLTVPVSVEPNQAIVIDMNSEPTATGYWVRCLPPDFPTLAVSEPGSPTPGYYLTGTITGGLYAMILNQNGTPVWYQQAPNGAINTTLLSDQTLAWSPNLGPGLGSNPLGAYTTYDLSTGATGALRPPVNPTDPHELLQLPDGDDLMITSPLLSGVDLTSAPIASVHAYSTIVDCVVEEFDPTTGALLWSWDAYKDGHILPDEDQDGGVITYQGQSAVDLYHCNSLDLSPGGTNLLVSSRHMDAVFDVAFGGPEDKQVLWKLGGNQATPEGAVHIVPTGDPDGTFSGQHDARILSVNAADQPTEISVFDDHTFADAVDVLPGGARGAEYSLNPTAGTAALVTELPAGGHATDSIATGSFRVYDGGADNLVGWGYQSTGSEFTEYDQSGNVLLDVSFPSGTETYRVVKVPLASLDLNLLRASAGLSPPAPPQVADGVAVPKAIGQPGGVVDAFYRGAQNTLLHSWYLPGAGWFGPQNFGGAVSGDPSPTLIGGGNQDVFWKGADGALWHVWYLDGTWYGPQSLGMGPLGGQPVSVSSASGQVDVFWLGADDGLWHAWFIPGGGWYGPQELWGAGGLGSNPIVVSASVETIDVFWKGSDGNLNRNWFNGSIWQGPTNLGDGPLGSAPSAAAYAPNDDLISWEGTDQNLWYLTMDSGTPSRLSREFVGSMASPPVAVSAAPSQTDVVWRGTDDVAAHLSYQGGTWTGPTELPSGWLGSNPSVTATSPDTEYVMWRGTDAGLWYTTGVGSSFSAVQEVVPGGTLATPNSAAKL